MILVDEATQIAFAHLDVWSVTADRDSSADVATTVALTGLSVTTSDNATSSIGPTASLSVADGLLGGSWNVFGNLTLAQGASDTRVVSSEIRVESGAVMTVAAGGGGGAWQVEGPISVDGVLRFTGGGEAVEVAALAVGGAVIFDNDVVGDAPAAITGAMTVNGVTVGVPIDCQSCTLEVSGDAALTKDVNVTGSSGDIGDFRFEQTLRVQSGSLGAVVGGDASAAIIETTTGTALTAVTVDITASTFDLITASRLTFGGICAANAVVVTEAGSRTLTVQVDASLTATSVTADTGAALVIFGTLTADTIELGSVSFGGTGSIVANEASFENSYVPLHLEASVTVRAGGATAFASLEGGHIAVEAGAQAALDPAATPHTCTGASGEGELFIKTGASLVSTGPVECSRLRLGSGQAGAAVVTGHGAAPFEAVTTHGNATFHNTSVVLSGNSSVTGSSVFLEGIVDLMGESLTISNGHTLRVNESTVKAAEVHIEDGGEVVMDGTPAIHASVVNSGTIRVTGHGTRAYVPLLEMNRGALVVEEARFAVNESYPLYLYEDDMVYGSGEVSADVVNMEGVVHPEADHDDTDLYIHGRYDCDYRDATTRFILKQRENGYGAMTMVVDDQMSFGGTLELVLEGDLPEDRETMPLIYYTRYNGRFDDVRLVREGVPQPGLDDNESVAQKLGLYTRLQYRDREMRLEIGRIEPDLDPADRTPSGDYVVEGEGGSLSGGAIVGIIAAIMFVIIVGIIAGWVVFTKVVRAPAGARELLAPTSGRDFMSANDDDEANKSIV